MRVQEASYNLLDVRLIGLQEDPKNADGPPKVNYDATKRFPVVRFDSSGGGSSSSSFGKQLVLVPPNPWRMDEVCVVETERSFVVFIRFCWFFVLRLCSFFIRPLFSLLMLLLSPWSSWS